MRKLFALLLSVMLVFCCAAALAENAADENICTYTVYNETGEKVVELYLYDTDSEDKGENYAGEEGLAYQASVEIKGENKENYVKTLYFKTEGGYEASFTTLHFETVPISLLPKESVSTDAVSGATPINFFVPYHTAHYTLSNQTGEKVTKVTFTNNATEEVTPAWDEDIDHIDCIEPDASLPTWINCEADKTKELEMTLTFETESGYTAEFKTLHFEDVQINLLAADALTGATPISFSMLPAAE